jgi:hypothetical protein
MQRLRQARRRRVALCRGADELEAWAEPVTFHNPLQDRPFTQTVYLARTAAAAANKLA